MTNLLPNQQIVLDNVAEQGFLAFYRTLSDKSDTTIRFFDRQDYYTVHGQDALLASKEFFKTSTVIKYLGSGERKVASCVLSKMNFESFIKELLLIRQYRVELYRNKSGKNNWELVGKASPGNLQQFEEVLFGNTDMSSTTVVMAVQLCADSSGQRSIGAAFADPALRKFDVCEFVDNDQFSNLEALLVQLTPKECLFNRQESNADHVKIKQVLERSNVLVTDKKKGDFNAKDITQDLNRLLKHASGNSAALPELDLASSMSCLAALIKYLELLSDSDAFGQFTLSTFDLNQYMKLDASAAKALNLFPSQGDGGDKHMCISGLLNKCKTPQGQRLELQWVKQPLLDKNKIEERLNLVEVFFENGELRQIVQEDHLRRFPDISRLAKKFQRQRATLQDCVKVYQAAQRLPMLAQLLSSYTGNHHQLVKDAFAKPLEDATEDFSKFMELVETTVDLNQVDQHEFLIKAEFDEGLQECKEKIDDLLKRFPVELNKAARDLGLEPGKTIKLESNSQLGYFFRVTLKDEKALRNNKKYFTIETRKDGCRFSNSSLKSLNEEFQSLRETYNDVQSQLANEVIKVAAGYSDPMLSVSDTVAFLDVIVSFAHVASHAPIPYSRPKVYEKGEGNIILKASRHPCLELQDDVSFIANDVKLIRGNSEFQIITGPNMGGKSTYIRQVGVISLLAQIGSFVPCEEAEVTILDSILARVGASDSQLRGVSTFMSEMLETASILRSASKDSLIIIDELGRGTSTYDGFGLAWAISEHIATKIKAFCMFATHFHELTALADVVPSVSNLHVTALTANGSLTLLYKVKSGVCDRSFGIHVAQLAHFPDKVVETAKRKARELEDFEGSLWDTETSTGDYDGDLGSLSKKRRKEKQDGEDIIEEFFQRLRHLLETEESEEEFATKLAALKGDVRSKDNSYIRQLLAK